MLRSKTRERKPQVLTGPPNKVYKAGKDEFPVFRHELMPFFINLFRPTKKTKEKMKIMLVRKLVFALVQFG